MLGDGLKDRDTSILEISKKEYDEFEANKELSRAFIQASGKDMLVILKNAAYGSVESNGCAIYVCPSLSKTIHNISHSVPRSEYWFDGTGMHCGKTDRFNVALRDKNHIRFPYNIIVDPRLVKANLMFRNGSTIEQLRGRVVGRARRTIRQLFG